MRLRIDESDILYYAAQYLQDETCMEVDETCMEVLVPEVQERGCLTKSNLIELSDWQLEPRYRRGNRRNIEKNGDRRVEKITRSAFRTRNESDRINELRRLKGVGWAVGSAILHWFHRDPYPIWDPNALWTVGVDESQYGTESEYMVVWKAYVPFCRDLAERNEVDMRTLDRALWHYSRINQ